MKIENGNAEFSRLSKECRRHLRAGRLDWYSFDLKSMAKLLDRERKYADKAKVLMIAFYIDLSGIGHPPFVDRASVLSLKAAIRKSGMNEYEVKELYLDSVRSDTTPRHIMTVNDSLYLMELSLNDREYEVGEILSNFRINAHREELAQSCRIISAESQMGECPRCSHGSRKSSSTMIV